MTQAISTGTFTTAKWIVSSDATQGTHTTIASALTSASSGDTIFIRPGTYTENITLVAGVNLTAFTCDNDSTGVVISGTVTASYNGTVQISGVRFQTNSAAAIALSSANTSELNIFNSYLNFTNNDGITANAANFSLTLTNCRVVAASTYKVFSVTTISALAFRQGSVASTDSTASTIAAGNINLYTTDYNSRITTSSTGGINAYNCRWTDNAVNGICLTTAGTGSSSIYNSFLSSGSASTVSIGSGTTVNISNSSVSSSNTNAITGAGSLNYNNIVFLSSSSTINTTTKTKYSTATAFSVVRQVFTGNGTYTPTVGMVYCDIECVGGGGASGGVATTAATTISVSGGGGGGGYAKKVVSSATVGASQTVTVGAGGTAGSVGATTGGTGGTTSVGALVSASGGVGSTGAAAAAQPGSVGGSGGAGSSGDFNTTGTPGGLSTGNFISGVFSASSTGAGGSTYFGGGTKGNFIINGGTQIVAAAGTSYGGGASGADNHTSQTQQAGAAGAAGLVVITEYVLI